MSNQPPDATSHRLIELFLEMIAAERGAAVNTLEAYRRDLVAYAAGLKALGRGPLDAETQDLRAYLVTLDALGFKPTSAARKLSAIRQFHRFLVAEGERTDDPAAILEGPRQGLRLPKILSVKEVDRLLGVAKEGLDLETRPAGERLRAARMNALLELLYATGLRVSELVSLPRHALRGRDPLIAIKGKGGRERLVVVSEPARQAVDLFRAILKTRHPGAVEGPWLFPADSESGQELGQLVHLAGSEGDVDEGESGEHLILDRLCPAAADADGPRGIFCLEALGMAEVSHEAIVGLLPNRAGVEQDQVRLVLTIGLVIAQRVQHPLHPLGVVLVHLTAERGQVVALHGSVNISDGSVPQSGVKPGSSSSSRAPGELGSGSRARTWPP